MQKLERIKPYKNADPMATVQWIRRILYENDIFVIETSQIKEPVTGVCSCRVILGDEGVRDLNIGANGKGMNARYALASAYAEFMERFQSSWLTKDVVLPVPDALTVTRDELDVMSRSLITLAYGDTEAAKVMANKFLSGSARPIVIPFKDYESDKIVWFPNDLIDDMTSSNGRAAGNTILEAMIQGLSEIFEREAMRTLFMENLTPPTIDEKYFEGTEVLRRLKLLRNRGINFQIKDCSLDKGFPVIGVLLEKENKYHIHFGADPSPITALERCLTEIFQGVSIDNIHFSQPLSKFENEQERFTNLRMEMVNGSGNIPPGIIQKKSSWIFDGFSHPITKSDEEDMNYYLRILSNLGKRPYVRETGFLGFPAIRVYVPGISEAFCPSPEYYQARDLPENMVKLIRNMPALSDIEYNKLALGLTKWLKKNPLDLRLGHFYGGTHLGLKRAFPAGCFLGRNWDDKLLIAAIYLRGGLNEQGMELLESYIADNGLSAKDSEILKLKLCSRSLTFLPTEWPQCPECSNCRAKHRCCQKQIDELYRKLNEK